MPPLLEVEDLTVRFRTMGVVRQMLTRTSAPWVEAVSEVSFELEPARTLALVGESGSGKTTLGRALIGLVEPSSGRIRFNGAGRPGRSGSAWKRWRRQMAMMFQDPVGSLSPRLAVRAFGLDFPSPIGLAAGFDKNAQVPDAMARFGFGFVECGTVTPRPQAGNPRPRLFRLAEDRAVINRMGFNNGGMALAACNLKARQGRGIVGINIGANKDSADRIEDYALCFAELAPLADYVTVNVSSPNTPGLRGLQGKDELTRLLATLTEARAKSVHKPILLKIAPDLDEPALDEIAEVVKASGIEGLIVSNTTIARPALRSPNAGETGGLSGKPLLAPST